MKLTREFWNRAVTTVTELERKDQRPNREQLADLLQCSVSMSRDLMFAIANRQVIRFEPEDIEIATGDVELYINDLHFPFQDDLAIETALKHADGLDPTIIVINGDGVDFYQISRFLRKPREKRVAQEISQFGRFLKMLRERFPKARIIYKEGNHENRLTRYIYAQASEIAELIEGAFQNRLELERLKIEYVVNPFRIGRLWHLHGHEKPQGGGSPEYITNVMWKYVHDHFIVGHWHRTQDKTFKKITGETFWGAAIGYLAGAMDYAPLNNWDQAFAVIRYNPDGSFKPRIIRINDGQTY